MKKDPAAGNKNNTPKESPVVTSASEEKKPSSSPAEKEKNSQLTAAEKGKSKKAVASQQRAAEKAAIKAFGFLQVVDYKSACEAASEAVRYNPKDASYQAMLSLALRGAGKFSESAKHALEAHELAPNKPDITFVYALSLWSAGDTEEASLLFLKALSDAPQRSDMRLDYAGFLLHTQNFYEALEQVQIASLMAPDHPKTAVLLHCAKQQIWQPEVDVLAFRPPLPLPEDKPETYITLGKAHLKSNYTDLALDEFSRALDLDINNSTAKSLYATAFTVKENDFLSWCKDFRQKLLKPLFAFIFIILPLIVFVGPAVLLHNEDSAIASYVCCSIFLIYLLIIMYLYNKGGMRCTEQVFAQIVKENGLTPQGRRENTLQVLDVLDEVQGLKNKNDEVGDNEKVSVPLSTGTGEDTSRVKNQLRDSGYRLRNTSATFSALAALTFFILIGSVFMEYSPSIHTVEILHTVKHISAVLTVVFMAIAFWFRRRANSMMSRL